MSRLWRSAHAALLGLLASLAAYSSLVSPTGALQVWGLAVTAAAVAVEVQGLRGASEGTAAAALGLVVVAYLPAALATAHPPLLLLGFTSLALMAALLGGSLSLAEPMDRQRVFTKEGMVTRPGTKLSTTLATVILASFLLSLLLLSGGLLVALAGPTEWSVLLAALAVLLVVAFLATLPRRLSELPRPRRNRRIGPQGP